SGSRVTERLQIHRLAFWSWTETHFLRRWPRYAEQLFCEPSRRFAGRLPRSRTNVRFRRTGRSFTVESRPNRFCGDRTVVDRIAIGETVSDTSIAHRYRSSE